MSVCVSGIQHEERKAHAPFYILACGLSGSTIFFTLAHKRHDFGGEKRLANEQFEDCKLRIV
jgi:hypothetical protein